MPHSACMPALSACQVGASRLWSHSRGSARMPHSLPGQQSRVDRPHINDLRREGHLQLQRLSWPRAQEAHTTAGAHVLRQLPASTKTMGCCLTGVSELL